MRLLNVRVVVAAAALSCAAVIAGGIAFALGNGAIWLLIGLQLAILIAVVLGFRALRNAVRIIATSESEASGTEAVRYAPGEPLDMLRRDLQRDVSALLGLYSLVEVPALVPPPGGWAATPETLLALVSEIQRADRIGTIVECGSGTSTIWMALALRKRGEGRVISLEHDPDYAAQTRRQLVDLGLDDVVEIRVGGLSDQVIDGRMFTWFGDDLLDQIDDVSLLFVDGPPGHFGSMVRYPALPKLRSRLAANAIVVLDDVDRAEELAVLDAWRQLEPRHPKIGVRYMTDRAAILAYDLTTDHDTSGVD